ncbi:hypothetical protein ACSDR0_11570 [Streptosporangium sp. G11]|uniref:hypothetical protein n=1 Tax=Streptosporangium sp. G11 TaxID=3436926 RepID=UPI003EBE3847
MTKKPTAGQLARATWANRPNLLEALFVLILVLLTNWLTGIPAWLLIIPTVVVMTAITVHTARRELSDYLLVWSGDLKAMPSPFSTQEDISDET